MNETRSGPTFFRKPAQTLNVNLGKADLALFQQKKNFCQKFAVAKTFALAHFTLAH